MRNIFMFVITVILFFHHYKYPMNVTHYHLVDMSRKELYPHKNEHQFREITIHIYLPIANQYKEQQLPVIIFSHGLGGIYNGLSYYWLCENLVGIGYAVVCISHTYACKPLLLPKATQAEYLFPLSSLHFQSKDYFSIEREIWVSDTQYVINWCEQQSNDTNSTLYDMFDLSKIVVMGHSFGGEVAIHMCCCDDQIIAAVNMDGPLHSPYFAKQDKPVLFLIGQLKDSFSYFEPAPLFNAFLWSYHMKAQLDSNIMDFFNNNSKDVSIVIIPQVVHEMFSDLAYELDCSLHKYVMLPMQAHALMNSYINTFLHEIVDKK